MYRQHNQPITIPKSSYSLERVPHRIHHANRWFGPVQLNTIVYFFYSPATKCHVTAPILTSLLCHSAQAIFPTLGFAPAEISAQALCAGGAMALLCAQVILICPPKLFFSTSFRFHG
jgi:hypothetical protein